MRLGQSVGKVCKTKIEGFNYQTGLFEDLPFMCSYPPDGRFIGRSVSFYDRRVLITPEQIDDLFPIVRIGDEEVLMIYASQQNINRGHQYLWSHTGFNIQGYADVHRLITTTVASGAKGKGVDTAIGNYPVSLEKGFSGPPSQYEAGYYSTRMSCYIPAYADVKLSDTIVFQGETYTIDESAPELRLRFLQLTKK